ncbi:lipocalin family protein [Luteimonas sp. A501]
MIAARPLSVLSVILAAALVPATAAHAQTGPGSRLNIAVDAVDLERYAGTWYEQMRLPMSFQRKCVGDTTAEYGGNPDGTISVVNRCRTDDGSFEESRGIARKVDGSTSMLEVRFAPAWLSWLPVVWGDYWVIALDPEYEWAMVGAPDADYLWILSRTPKLDDAVRDRLVTQASDMGYPVQDLVATPQRQAGPRSN